MKFVYILREEGNEKSIEVFTSLKRAFEEVTFLLWVQGMGIASPYDEVLKRLRKELKENQTTSIDPYIIQKIPVNDGII